MTRISDEYGKKIDTVSVKTSLRTHTGDLRFNQNTGLFSIEVDDYWHQSKDVAELKKTFAEAVKKIDALAFSWWIVVNFEVRAADANNGSQEDYRPRKDDDRYSSWSGRHDPADICGFGLSFNVEARSEVFEEAGVSYYLTKPVLPDEDDGTYSEQPHQPQRQRVGSHGDIEGVAIPFTAERIEVLRAAQREIVKLVTRLRSIFPDEADAVAKVLDAAITDPRRLIAGPEVEPAKRQRRGKP